MNEYENMWYLFLFTSLSLLFSTGFDLLKFVYKILDNAALRVAIYVSEIVNNITCHNLTNSLRSFI